MENNDEGFNNLERLSALKAKGIITEAEFEQQKAKILGSLTNKTSTDSVDVSNAQARVPTLRNSDKKLGQGVSLLVGVFVLFLVLVGILQKSTVTQDQVNEALGFLIIFGAWIIPHSIWIITRPAANKVMPIIALAGFGFCCLAFVGSQQ